MSWEDLVRDLVGNVGLSGKIATDARNANLAQQQMGAQTALLNAQVSDAQRKAHMRQQFDADVAVYLKNPTPDAIQALASRYPEYAQELKQAWQLKDTAQVRADRTVLGSAYSALKNKRPDLALATLRRRRDAEKERGINTSALDEQIAALESGDENAAKSVAGALLAQLSASDENFGASYENIGGEVQGEGLKGYGPGTMILDAEGNVVRQVPFAPRPVTVSEGQTVVEYQPGGGGQASGGAGGGSPRGVRNNNLGNLRDGPFARSQPGYTGRDDSGFAIFETPEAGNAAQERLLSNNYLSKGFNTPRSIVNRYAPPSENSAASINNYAAYIARKLGIGPDDPVPPGQVGVLAQAMREFENGQTGGGGARVIAQGNPKAKPTRMTPQEVAAEGLDPSRVYYRGTDGVPKEVGGQTTKDAKLTEVESKATGYLSQAVAATNALNTVKGYNASEVAMALNDLSNKNPIKRNLSQTDRRVLNAQLAFANGILRLETGAAIQPFEIAQKAQVLFPMPGDGPEVQADKRRQREAALAALRVAAGRGARTVKPAIPAGSTLVRSPQEAKALVRQGKLKPGDVIVTPDGRIGRVK